MNTTNATTPTDPDRPLSKNERRRALHFWRQGLDAEALCVVFKRSNKTIQRWAASNPEIIEAAIAKGRII